MRDRRYFAVIAFGYIASISAYSQLPGPYLVADPRLLFARPMIAFLMPTMAALTYLLLRSLWVRDPIRDREETFEATYDAILLRIILFVIILHVIVLAGMVGLLHARTFAPRIVVMLLGLLLVAVGNLLPRMRPNIVVGIRTSRSMADRGPHEPQGDRIGLGDPAGAHHRSGDQRPRQRRCARGDIFADLVRSISSNQIAGAR